MASHFVWTARCKVSIDPQVAGLALKKMAKRGELTAAAVVDAARPDGAPLHEAFEWDDAIAAEKHRAEQARLILRSIRIVGGDDQEPERVYWHVATETVDAYVTTARVREEDELRAALLSECVRTLMSARKKYAELVEMAEVWTVIDQLEFTNV